MRPPPSSRNPITVSYDFAKNQIAVSTTFSEVIFHVLTSGDMDNDIGDTTWVGPSFDPKRSNNINDEMLEQSEGRAPGSTSAPQCVSECVSLQPTRNIYIYSPNLGRYSTDRGPERGGPYRCQPRPGI